MNEQIPQTKVRTTQFADGLPRRCWTVAEIAKLWNLGIFGGVDRPHERFELFQGEIVPMSPKGLRHELIKIRLSDFWYRNRSTPYTIAAETPLTLRDDTQPQPDLVVLPANFLSQGITPGTVLLVVEIADTSLAKDTRYKAGIYASAGVRDYWVINAATLVTTVFRDPTEKGYQSRAEFTPDQTLTPLDAPELALALNDLGL